VTPWRRRLRKWGGLAALGVGGTLLALLALLAGVVARPAVLAVPVNWWLGDRPIRVQVDDARLGAPSGWLHPSRWQWRIEGFSVVSHQPGTPTLLADVLVVRMPDLRRSWQQRSIVLPEVDALNFIVAVPDPTPPPPFEEADSWPVRGLVIDQGVLRGFELVVRDATGTTILADGVDGQIVGFRYDFGHREMFGHAASRGGHVVVGPIEACNVQAIPVAFAGTTMEARGFGYVGGQRTDVRFSATGLLRPGADIDAEFDMDEGDLRSLLADILGDQAPNVDGKVSGQAVFESEPPEAHVGITFQLHDGQVTLADDTRSLVLTALKLAPFVELDDHLLRLGVLSGHLVLSDGVITLTGGRYQADRSAGQVDGRVDRTSLRARVRFSPEPGASGVPWGILLTGSPQHPKVQLADPEVLEAWSQGGDETAKDIRQDVRQARRDRRDTWRTDRDADRHEDPDGETPADPPWRLGPTTILP
jgi:hypothetical protein